MRTYFVDPDSHICTAWHAFYICQDLLMSQESDLFIDLVDKPNLLEKIKYVCNLYIWIISICWLLTFAFILIVLSVDCVNKQSLFDRVFNVVKKIAY